jgi:hypothetical protein
MPLLKVISLGRFLIPSTQLLANAIDVDGDDLSVVNLSVVSSDVDNVRAVCLFYAVVKGYLTW